MRTIFLALTGLVLLTSCDKNGEASVNVFMTDQPDDYEHLYLIFDRVDVNVGDGWQLIELSESDTVDILAYTDGNLYPLVTGDVESGEVTEIRLILNDNATLVLEDGSLHDIKVPSGSSSGLKIKLDNPVNLESDGSYNIIVDFDAEKSIVKQGNGGYLLKPVISAVIE